MRRFGVLLVVVMMLAIAWGIAFGAEKAPQKVVDLTNTKLVLLGTDPVIVEAVKAENAKGKTLEQIKELDKEWQKTAGVTDYMQALMDSECGKHLRSIQDSEPYYSEIFVMDNQGALVALTDKTSDYWQGDEAKFTESYKDGKGAVHIGDVEFDESTQAYLVQVSLPVKDGDQVIGAMTIGLDVEKLQ